MAKLSILAGATSQSVNVWIQDSSSTVGAGLSGLVFNTSGLIAYYTFTGANATSVQISLVTLSLITSAFSSGGFKEVDATNMKGLYRLDLPNTALASAKGRVVTIILSGAANMAPCVLEVELTGWDNQDAVHGGLSSLPNATAGASAGLIINGSNSGTVTIGDGIVVNRSTANSDAVQFNGSGSGNGLTVVAGAGSSGTAGGIGVKITGGAGGTTGASGAGISVTGGAAGSTSGNASPSINLIGGAATAGTGTGAEAIKGTGGAASSTAAGGNALTITGGVAATGKSGGIGISITGGAASTTGAGGAGITITGANGGTTSAGQDGITVTSGSSGTTSAAAGNGITITAGAATAGSGAAGTGLKVTGGTATSTGTAGVAISVTGGSGAASSNGAASGVTITGGGTNTVSSTADGITITGASNGNGMTLTHAGTGKDLNAQTTNALQVNTTAINAVATTSVTTVNANIGVTQPVNFTGTGASALVKSDTIDLASQTVTAAAGVTFPSSVASPTNITAGTITTVTNLTNAPTSGDFTATMKTSLNAATPASITNMVMTTGTAQAGGTDSITLAAGASATNGIYDPGLIIINSGTGAGQARTILDYNGTTKVATVDRDWRTNPDSSSVYTIFPVSNLVSTNEGLAQGGGASTITLNGSGSSVNNTYNGQIVVIRGGTGQDQTRIVTAYNGSTKVATVDSAWVTNPDSTSIYMMIQAGYLDATISSRMATYTQPTGFLAATFPTGTIANTTNITAGTITTATNLTNAPTAGDFTSTMKTSLNNSTPASITGAVGSVTAGVTVTTNNDKTGYALSSAGIGSIFTTSMTEAYAAQGATLTAAQALYGLTQQIGQQSITGTTMTVQKRDGITTAKTYILNSPTAPTAIIEAT